MCHVANLGSSLDGQKIERIEKIEELASSLMLSIDGNCPNDKEKKEAKKYLAASIAWARAAIIRQH